ncbi:MAG: hypothetical protein Q7R85_00985 [bacterium]|nr:hypothetical protein [bacterium]
MAGLVILITMVILTFPKFKRDVESLGEPQRKIQQELAELKKLVAPEPPHCVFDDVPAKLQKGMTEDEALAAVKSCNVPGKPKQDFSRDEVNPLTGENIRSREILYGMYIISGRNDWMMELGLYFADGKLYDVARRSWRSMEWKRTHWQPEIPKNK